MVAAFPVEENDQLMLVTDGGKLIRMPVAGIRIAGRTTRGVTLFRIDDKERVVSVAWMGESEDDDALPEGPEEDESGAEAEAPVDEEPQATDNSGETPDPGEGQEE